MRGVFEAEKSGESSATLRDDCIFEYPGDVPKDIKAIVAPWAKGKKKHISAVLSEMGEE